MKRLHPKLFNIATAVSLFACAATAVIWVQSFRSPWTTSIVRNRGDFRVLLESEGGEFRIGETHEFEVWHIAYWKLCILFLIPPARWVQRRSARIARARIGYCSICGYDLRATPARCPECGTVPSSETPKAWKAIVPRWTLLLIIAHVIASYGLFGGMIAYFIVTEGVSARELPMVLLWLIGTPVWPFRLDLYSLDRWDIAMYLGIAAISIILLNARIKSWTIPQQSPSVANGVSNFHPEYGAIPPVARGPAK